jgi:probable phosphoglycerate mutase
MLTDVGINQVGELGEQLEAENFGFILTSSLGRAIQTAEVLSRQLSLEIERPSANLAERGEGAFQGLTRAQQIERYPECFDRETGREIPDLIPGVKRTTDFLARVSVGLQEIGSFAKDMSVLVVTHTGVLQALASLIYRENFVEESARRSFRFCDVLRFDSSQIKTL